MGFPLAEYQAIRPLRESARSRVYEAVSERDSRAVIAKVFDIEDEADEDRVQHEFELIQRLEIEGIVKARELRRVGNQLVLILERAPGVNLSEYAGGRPIPLTNFWPIATRIATILAQTHSAQVIHRDIKPTNILIDPHTRRVHLVDFGISVLLANERRHIYDADVLSGTLPYISPEQTGRTSRAVDRRSDLYSLGVTFYELLTGHLPFEGLLPLELIHAHLAREPEPPTRLRPELSAGLSGLVLKLLAKAPEHRYQTAAGLAADLRRLQALHEAGLDDAHIELGAEDFTTNLLLPQRLYGRERERAELSEAFAVVAGSGGRQTIALTGPLGVGKSLLVRELETTVISHGGYMLGGKFDPHRDLPYAAFEQALTVLFEQLLTESDARLERWRRRLTEMLGGLASVLAELCPTVELIVGPQPKPARLDAAEARNRLLVTVERLLSIVCSDRRPIALVLEDLHWADQGSLKLLEALIHGHEGPLLLVFSLRREDLGEDHPLWALIAELENHPRARELELGGISTPAIEALLTDALPGAREVGVLARTITRKTNGVPLFVGQFLAQLAQRELLRPSAQGWVWDQDRVDAEPIPDDAVAMMGTKLQSLSASAREVIRRAACIGSRFELPRLALVCSEQRSQLTACLFELEAAGLLTHLGGEYQFVHDSIQDAAQQGLADDARRDLHWTIGRELLAGLAASDERLFEVVDHLTAGAPADPDHATRLELAELDLRAGTRGLDTGAYDLAQSYLSRGIELTVGSRADVIARGPQAPDYELSFRLHFSLAYSLALNGLRRAADRAFTELLDWRLADHHYGEVVARRVRLLWVETRHFESVELGLEALARLGSPIPRAPTRLRAMATLYRAWRMVRGLDDAAIQALPRCEDERSAAVLDLVDQVKNPAFIVDNRLYLYLIGLHPLFIRTHGVHSTMIRAIGDLSIGVGGGLGKIADAVRMQDLASDLARAEPTAKTLSRVLALGGAMSLHRGRGFAEIVALFDASYPAALEAGEFDSASFIGGFGGDMQLEVGTHLRVLDRHCRRVARDVGRWCPNQMKVMVWMLRGLSLSLRGAQADTDEAVDRESVWDLDPEQILAHDGAHSNYYVGFIAKALHELVFGNHAAALVSCLRCIHDVEKVVFNTWFVARAYVLTCAAYSIRLLAGGAPSALAKAGARKGLRGLERWTKHSPANYGHYLDLARGLRYAVRGQPAAAARLLDRAWSSARKRGCRWIEGIAAEQLAALLERQGMTSLVDGARQRAWAAYAAWGADAKLDQLLRAHPGAFAAFGGRQEVARASSPRMLEERLHVDDERSSASGSTPRLDLAAVLRTVGAISEDLRLDEVIRRVLDAAMTSVGADHGLLVLEQGRELTLVAEAAAVGSTTIFPDPPLLRDVGGRAPSMLINFVVRSGQSVVLDDARSDQRFAGDPYLEHEHVRSVLALPLVKGERRLGALVVENRLTTHGFSPTSIKALKLITGQAASTLENALLYSALRSSEARWRSLVDGAPDLIALLDERGRIVFRNHSGPLTGLDEREEDHLDRADRDDADAGGSLRPESAKTWRAAVEGVLADGQRREFELEFIPHAEPIRWYAVRVAPIEVRRTLLSETDTVHRNAVAVATDITAQKQAEAERQAFDAQVREHQRLESVGTLASGVAHEINNPIQGIMNYADLIQASSSDAVMIEFATEIIYESNRVASIIRNLLAFSRQHADDAVDSVALGEVIDATLSLVRSLLRGDYITVEVEITPDLPLVRCRAQHIQQVVMNLITNARDALNERYGAHDIRKRIDIRVERAQRPGWVRVSISDTADGIPEDVLPRIFDPFFTTKDRSQGTGLGLAVSHGIIKDHGGELLVETKIGEGTRFLVELPALTDDALTDS
ncbi:protein kinase domain-containing protein [Enhygromyxa salina]|uniref:histidine kinase n=1 Tax=Enhygromyxa salina TaxID=215803 RepID=A0A2S9YVU0_9BACT|nr:AAA family ATPase [Enhygromyxa salina]PRQ09194.1 Serine/threonine-protein kinase PknB [Enhygromyxa salina]